MEHSSSHLYNPICVRNFKMNLLQKHPQNIQKEVSAIYFTESTTVQKLLILKTQVERRGFHYRI